MKSAMYVIDVRDSDFLRAYWTGLVLTLAMWYVLHSFHVLQGEVNISQCILS